MFLHVGCVVPGDFLSSYVVRPHLAVSLLCHCHPSLRGLEAVTLFDIHKAVHAGCNGTSTRGSTLRVRRQRCVHARELLPSMCLTVCEESSQRPAWRATMPAVAVEPLMRPTEDTLCPVCRSTWPFMCTENTSGSELIPTRCRLTEAKAHTLTSGQRRGKCRCYLCRTPGENLPCDVYHKVVFI